MRTSMCTLLACLFAAGSAQAGTVRLERAKHSISISIDGSEFAVYHVDPARAKPYFWPMRAEDGAILTRGLENPEDHPHHKGVWCAIDEVNGIKFWAEEGRIRNVSVEIESAEGDPARLKVENHWLDADLKPVLIEKVRVSLYASRLLVYDSRFVAGEKPVRFDDTKEGLFGIRLADTLREQAGGRIVNSEGLKGEKECWGLESKWVDYFGEIEGKTYGVALFDHPANVRRSRYHVRGYGLFTLSPFGQSAYTYGKLPADPLTLEPAAEFRLRYGLYVHDGDTQTGNVATRYDEFVKAVGD